MFNQKTGAIKADQWSGDRRRTHMFGTDISFLASPSRSDILFSAGATRLSQTKQEDHEMLEWAVLKRQSADSIPSGNLT